MHVPDGGGKGYQRGMRRVRGIRHGTRGKDLYVQRRDDARNRG